MRRIGRAELWTARRIEAQARSAPWCCRSCNARPRSFRYCAGDREPAVGDMLVAGNGGARRAPLRNRPWRQLGANGAGLSRQSDHRKPSARPALNTEKVAELVGISPRYLQDLFTPTARPSATSSGNGGWRKAAATWPIPCAPPTASRRSRSPAALPISDISAAATRTHSASPGRIGCCSRPVQPRTAGEA